MKANKLFLLVLILYANVNARLLATTGSQDSLLQVATYYQNQNQNEKEAIITYRLLGKSYAQQGNYELALVYYQKALSVAKAVGDYVAIAENQYKVAFINGEMGNYKTAIEKCLVSMELAKTYVQEDLWLKNIKRIASYYVALGDYEQSYTYLLEALTLLEIKKDIKAMVPIYYEMGSNFFFQENYKEALRYYLKALNLPKPDKRADYYNYDCTGAIGSTYARMGEVDKAMVYNKRALEMAEELDYKIGIVKAEHNLAEDYVSLGQYKTALKHYKKAYKLIPTINHPYSAIACLMGMGKLYSKINKHEDGLKFLQQSLKLATNIGNQSLVKDVYMELADAHFMANNSNEGFRFQKKYIDLKDQIISEKTRKRIDALKLRYEVQKEKRENKIKMLEKEAQINQLRQYFLIGGSVLLLLILGLGLNQYQMQGRSNSLLEQKNREIGLQNERLAASNQDLAQFAFITSHDLKEPLRTIGSYTSLIERRYGDKFDDAGKEFLHYISGAIDRMYNLLSDILTYSQVNNGYNNKQTKFTTINTNEMVNQVLDGLKHAIEKNNAVVKVNALPIVQGNTTQMTQLFQNLISNAIKFNGKKEPIIIVDCKVTRNNYVFTVKDNGIGIEKEYWDTIFVPFKRLHNRDEYEGTGVGLAICQKVVEQHKGKIWLESGKNKGTTFFISFPKKMKAEELASTYTQQQQQGYPLLSQY